VSPLDCLVDHGRRLVDAGAGLVVTPCNTAHLWYDAVQAALGVDMIHLVDAALDDAQALVAAAAKAADLSAGQALLGQAARALESRGAAALVLGCTEIPVALDAGATSLPLIDATAALARRAVQWSMARRQNIDVVRA
jgi:aspartate racemase